MLDSTKEVPTPTMHKIEYEALRDKLKKDDTVLEYGIGSSTLYFSPYVSRYIGIEHNYGWFKKVQSQAQDNVELYHVDCYYKGNSVHCDYESELERERWRPYFEKVHNIPFNKYDKVLIDGRARAYCALEVKEYLKDNGILIIHDYTFREKYHSIVEKQYRITSTVDSLVFFEKR